MRRAAFEEVEYFLRVIYALLVFQAGGLLFHAAGIVRDGQCYLFFGHSGSGKTTVARLSSTDLVLNDDLVVLIPRQISSGSPMPPRFTIQPRLNPLVHMLPRSKPCLD